MKNKDEKLTYKELTALCRKQEEYIKELEDKLKIPSDTESGEPVKFIKPTYHDLYGKNLSLSGKVDELEQENNALRYSLTKMHSHLKCLQEIETMLQEEYHKEHSRAEQLFDELNKQQ